MPGEIGQYESFARAVIKSTSKLNSTVVLYLFTKKINCFFFFFFFLILLELSLIGNRTSCRPILSVIILMIKQMRSSDFVYHSYDYRPNQTPLSPITMKLRCPPRIFSFLSRNIQVFSN